MGWPEPVQPVTTTPNLRPNSIHPCCTVRIVCQREQDEEKCVLLNGWTMVDRKMQFFPCVFAMYVYSCFNCSVLWLFYCTLFQDVRQGYGWNDLSVSVALDGFVYFVYSFLVLS